MELQANWQKTPLYLELQLQDDNFNPSMYIIYPEENLPMDFLGLGSWGRRHGMGGLDKPSELPEEIEIFFHSGRKPKFSI